MMDFHSLYQSYAPQAHRLAPFLCGDATLADDIIQRRLCARGPHAARSGEATVKAYLFTIARNLYRCTARSRNNRLTELEESIPDPSRGAGDAASTTESSALCSVRVASPTDGSGMDSSSSVNRLLRRRWSRYRLRAMVNR